MAAAQSGGGFAPPTSTTPARFIPEQIPVAFNASHYTRTKTARLIVTAPPLSADADKGDQDTLVLAFGGNSNEPLDVAVALVGPMRRKHDFESETFVAFDTTSITQPSNRSNPQPGDPVHARRQSAPARHRLPAKRLRPGRNR